MNACQAMAAFASVEQLTGGRYEDRFYIGINKGVDNATGGKPGRSHFSKFPTF